MVQALNAKFMELPNIRLNLTFVASLLKQVNRVVEAVGKVVFISSI